ncbi:hypothetical protein ACWKWW_12915 [Chryseobacterium cucumeris]
MKKILILRACGLSGEKQECDNIKSQCELYEIKVYDHCPKTNDEINEILKNGTSYDYIYLSSHGNKEGFGSEDGIIDYNWLDFGEALCAADCMNEDCIIMLSCCRGGLNEVAYSLFYCCENISYVVGPRQSLSPDEMLISFNILLYNLQYRNIDPIVACEKIKLATDIRFVCFDSMETMSDIGYLNFTSSLSQLTINTIKVLKNKYSD